MKHLYVRPGTYRAQVKSRRTIKERGRTAIELTFTLEEKHLSGQCVTGRFWRHVLLERATTLCQGQPVEVDVITGPSRRGKPHTTVKDFRPAGSPTVVSFVGGICTDVNGDRVFYSKGFDLMGNLTYVYEGWNLCQTNPPT